ncbi:PAS domain S-box protein [Methanoculleus sp. Wushi-C6]|uniref:histidine kinase n=1 Tax=Methanoculleus caldifontis TaxID=2651577 RepID=A0ABU3X1A6_9EURY|nr:PAS domain S-box protein [Methanoculleus sp. Wushi-C6]MDV2481844.1 PAS domain S-box protein [Methanoculleus sp. Wushi-C6]
MSSRQSERGPAGDCPDAELIARLQAENEALRRENAEFRQAESGRRRAEESLLWRRRREELLADVASRLLSTEEPQQIVNDLCGKTMAFLECDVFFNYLVDAERDCMYLNASEGIPEEEAERIAWLDYGVAVCGCAARDGCRIVAEDIPATLDPRTDLVRSYGVQAYACHPLVVEGVVLGTLSFGTRSRTRFRDRDLEVMKTVADYIAIAMHRLISKRALEESEERFFVIFDRASFPIALLRQSDDTFVDVNEEWVKTFGHTREEARGKTSLALGIDRDPGTLSRIRTGLLRDGTVRDLELTRFTKAGEARIISNNLDIVTVDGEQYVLTVVQDITRRRQTEDELHTSLDRLALALDAISAGVSFWNIEHGWSEWNHRQYEILGYAPGTVEPGLDALLERVHPGDRDRVIAELDRSIREQKDYAMDYRVSLPGDEERWVHSVRKFAYDAEDRPVASHGIMYDITYRKRYEAIRQEAYAQIERNIEQFAVLGDHIRHPLQVILARADLLEDATAAASIQEQVQRINGIVRQLDRGWVESRSIRRFLKRNERA